MGVIILLFEKKQKVFVHFLRPFSSKRAELERSHAREQEPKSALPPRLPRQGEGGEEPPTHGSGGKKIMPRVI